MANTTRRRSRSQAPREPDRIISEPPRLIHDKATRPVTLYYSPTYWAEAPACDTFRKSYWIERELTTGGTTRNFVGFEEPDVLRDPDLEAVHTPAYLAAVHGGTPVAVATSNGLPWTAGLYAAAESASQGIAQAAVHALHTGRPTGSLSAGLHNARADRGSGHCTFNGLALAARAAINAKAGAILILDLDAHSGGGTWSIVSGWRQVWHVDVSVSDFDRYDSKGHPRSIVEHVTAGAHYLDTLRRVLDRLSTTTFELLIYHAGMNPFERCDGGGLPGISKETLDLRERLVFDWARARALPVAFTLGGGDTGPTVSCDDLVGLHLLTIDAANPARPTLAPPHRVATACPLGDRWRSWDFLNLPRRELSRQASRFNAPIAFGHVAEPVAATWERGPEDALYRPPTVAEGEGGAERFAHGSPAHAHAEFEVDGRRVHLDCISGTKNGPGRSWTEIVAFVDGACVAHGWTGGCSLGFGGTKNMPLLVQVHAKAALRVEANLQVTLWRRGRTSTCLTP
jgi:acetoin utilization deacetylase AcuC-like enzyme